MAFYRICPRCGAHLDPEETCDCQNERKPEEEAKENRAVKKAVARDWIRVPERKRLTT